MHVTTTLYRHLGAINGSSPASWWILSRQNSLFFLHRWLSNNICQWFSPLSRKYIFIALTPYPLVGSTGSTFIKMWFFNLLPPFLHLHYSWPLNASLHFIYYHLDVLSLNDSQCTGSMDICMPYVRLHGTCITLQPSYLSLFCRLLFSGHMHLSLGFPYPLISILDYFPWSKSPLFVGFPRRVLFLFHYSVPWWKQSFHP